MPHESAAIVTRGLTKTYKVRRPTTGRLATFRSLMSPARDERTVVSDLDLTVGRGELVGLLGPNGAGKSTSIKMLTGILTPTSGEVYVDGRVPHQNRADNARSIGAVFGQKTQLWWDLPARHSFGLIQDIFDIAPRDYERQLQDVDQVLGISEFWDTPVRLMSLGQRVRCDMAAAVLHDPAILFLDEPTIGMDVVAKERTRAFLLQQVHERGRAVVLTTHDMTDVARLCERVLLINHGRLVFDGTLDRMKLQYGASRTVNVTFGEPVAEVRVAGARVLSHEGTRATLAPEDGHTPEDVVRALIAGFPVVGMTVEETDLEELMRNAYEAKNEILVP
ncbi:ATP-binding cassette domain-containing protein [Streptomyces sp. NBC_01317]|uniref:ABC transporter ATP-binding protein n=1 Tax=Streptomyces sp. NBC_01317 TaxID=2903822 RepID=UPI002E12E4E2|nr:ATP-binding cassette domain-containing protein [Streptomyces sp. NBC_01317]